MGRRLEDALASIRPAALAALEAMAELTPEQLEIEFGVKLAGDAGALIAKGTSDAHFVLRMSWTQGRLPCTGRKHSMTGDG